MKQTGRRSGHKILYLAVAICLLAMYTGYSLKRPLPALEPDPASRTLSVKTTNSKLAWPDGIQAAVGIVGSDTLETNGAQTPAPAASTAKVITSLMVLKKYPLQLGQQGPTVTLTDKDVALYNAYVAQEGSVVPVTTGEQITEYQMLEAAMLPSANNISDSMAIWAYGSLNSYAAAANAYLAQLGLKNTHVGSDASGLAPDTISTAHDLVAIGKLAMQQPALAQIVGQATATGIPNTAVVKNVNFLLGQAGIVGLKTGNSDQAGGVFISASKTTIGNTPVTIVTALVHTPSLFTAVQGSLPLIQSAQANFSNNVLFESGAIISRYRQPWGGSIAASVTKPFAVTSWNGSTLPASVHMNSITATATKGQTVGAITTKSSVASSQSAPITLAAPPTKPSTLWRLTHPF